MDEKQQELMFRLSSYEQQISHMQQQLEAIEQAIAEMISLKQGLEELKGSEGKEIFAPMGKGIFTRAKLISEDLLVDVGCKNFVKKNIPDAKKLIDAQIKKLEEIKKEFQENLEKISEEITQTIIEAQKLEEKRGN